MDEYIILEYELPVLWHIFVKGLPIPSDNLQQSISYPLEQFAKAFPWGLPHGTGQPFSDTSGGLKISKLISKRQLTFFFLSEGLPQIYFILPYHFYPISNSQSHETVISWDNSQANVFRSLFLILSGNKSDDQLQAGIDNSLVKQLIAIVH
jgi:hypothetical protein